MLYVSILEGDRPEDTRPIITSNDPELVRAFTEALQRRVEAGLANGDARRALELLDSEGDPDE